MKNKSNACKNSIKALVILVIFSLMVMHPAELLISARYALETWWKSVLPALLPFFILAELMNRMGINKCLSIWLEPLMRPLFRLPGAAALAVVVGFVAGSPAGAMVTADLRKEKLITREEGERLLAFTNNAGPLFILSVTAGSVLNAPELGIILLLSHYPVNLLFGLILRFTAPKVTVQRSANYKNRFMAGINAISTNTTEPLAAILTACIKKSLQTSGIIACYMMICSLITALLNCLGIQQILASGFGPFLLHIGIDPATATAVTTGLLEMSIGIAALPASEAPLLDMTMAAALILGFNGLSVQAQVAAMVSDTDLKLNKYLLCRLIHGLTAPLIIFVLWQIKTPASAIMQLTGVNLLKLSAPSITMLMLFSLTIIIVLILAGLIIGAITTQRGYEKQEYR